MQYNVKYNLLLDSKDYGYIETDVEADNKPDALSLSEMKLKSLTGHNPKLTLEEGIVSENKLVKPEEEMIDYIIS